MSNKKLHIIQKQLIDITLPNATLALEWEASKRRDFTALINKQLERCFDDYDKNGEHLIIEKLDIDLGAFTMNSLQEEVPGRLYSTLYQTLQERFKTTTFTGLKSGERSYSEGSTDRFYSGREGRLEALFYFLDEGQLPWWGSELTDWNKDWLTALTENEVSRLKNFITRADEKPIRRLATQFDDPFIEQLLQHFDTTAEAINAWQWLKTLLKDLAETLPNDRNYSESRFQAYQKYLLPSVARVEYWVSWLLHTAGKMEIPTLYKLFANQPEALKIIYSTIIDKYKDTDLSTANQTLSIWEEEISAIIRQHRKHDDDETIIFDKSSQEKEQRESDGKILSGEEIKPVLEDKAGLGKPKDIVSTLTDKESKPEGEKEAIFVNNAGLIILHPFLPELFRHCGWVVKNRFISDYTQTMAVYALHYLATGQAAAPEHELVFPKFLTGMEWQALLEPIESLNDMDKAACNELLAEVLKYWTPLRNTSPQGLREAYLQRSGKLEHIYSGWHLSIEQKTLDILLNRLPWGISMIKLPWMIQPLTVAWQ